VDDHFLSYINPQEASALRAMGGGITAANEGFGAFSSF
jgi:hypothetical protein